MDNLSKRILAEKENVEVALSILKRLWKGMRSQLLNFLLLGHFFVHAYGFMLDEAHLEDLTNDIPEIWSQFLLEIEKYYKTSVC